MNFWIMMTKINILTSFIILFSIKNHAQELPHFKSNEIDESDYRFETNLSNYQKSENWKIWSFPFKNSPSGMQIPSTDTSIIPFITINDYDLYTCWKAQDSTTGIGQRFSFTMEFPDYSGYGGAYQFCGKINIFNGNCKSEKDWLENSRIKTMKVLLNDSIICSIELSDIWHFQQIDISGLFKNKYLDQNMDALYSLKSGDVLTFEITGFYPGSKHQSACLSEFLIEGGKN